MTKYDQPEHTSIISRHHHPLYRTKCYYYGLDPSQKYARKDIPTPLFQRTKMIHNTKKSCKSKNQILFQRTKMILQHTQILQSKPKFFVPENKNDPQHTQILQSKPIFYSREQK